MPLLLPSCRNVLETGRIDVAHITGCENWILLRISEITALLSWKKDSQRLGCLSMRDLAQRATTIEKRLLEKKGERSTKTSNASPSSFIIDVCGVHAVTEIFVLAALTYLHVVVSGPNPNLPEIRLSVSKTISALQKFRYPQQLRSLAWPLCITGCMAEYNDRTAVRDLMATASASSIGGGKLCSIYLIIKECWRWRDNGQGLLDWSDAMISLGEHIFLI